MSLCRYDISKPCDNHGTSSRTCLDCVLGKIRAEIEWVRLHKAQFLTNDNKVCIDSQEVLDIIDKYMEKNEPQENEEH